MNMGDKIRDTITGFEGTYFARTDYLFGCTRISIMRADKDGKPETEWFDAPQIELVKDEAVPEPLRRTGGGADPTRRADPTR